MYLSFNVFRAINGFQFHITQLKMIPTLNDGENTKPKLIKKYSDFM